MENLVIPKGEYTPEIKFILPGALSIKGRSIMKYSAETFEQAVDWINRLKQHPPSTIALDVALDALDTASVRAMVIIIKHLNDLHGHCKTVINWYHEQSDEDLMDLGTSMASISKVEFNLVAVPDEL